VTGTGSSVEVLARAAALAAAGSPFALATVTWRRGPSSGRSGCKAIVHPHGEVEGWLGGACAEPTVVREALEALRDGAPRVLALGVPDDRPGVTTVSMACASEGAMEVFVEPVLPAPRVWVVGGSPAVATLTALAGQIGWDARAVDDLDDDTASRLTAADMVVVATQGHADEPAVAAALASDAGYVGLVASVKRADALRQYLLDAGTSPEALTRLRAPAGLDLGSIAHHEIAVAVLAELVALRAARRTAIVDVRVPEQAVDPICGMSVDVATARFRTDTAAGPVYFCAAGCRRAYEAAHPTPP
jgi:xanthine dehydrogenase accessory factor